MKKETSSLKKYSVKTEEGISQSINDLREKEFNGEKLSAREKLALINFDRYRLNELSAQVDDLDFHRRYREMQVMANLGDYQEFLKEQYFI
jgi:hypothetical protein